MTTEQAEPVTIEPPADEPAAEIPANEPRTRLSFKQTHALVLFCQTIAEQTHETWVSLAAHATDKLGFRVTTYSLQMALEAAERDLKTMLKPAVEDTPIDKRVNGLCKGFEELEKQVGLLKGIVDKILDYNSLPTKF